MTGQALEIDESQPVHATSVVVDGAGIVITGPSGSGKTALGLAIVRRARLAELRATFVGDDQIYVRKSDEGDLVITQPDALANRVEIRGNEVLASGLDHQSSASVEIWVKLTEKFEAERYQSGNRITINGVDINYRAIWNGDREHAVTIVLTALGHPAWY